jgi:hypothetical protein
MSIEILIRLAGSADRDELRAMQARSFRELGAACYERSVIEAFIRVIGTLDDSLLEQGTYYAAVAGGAIVGCGGWSDRTPGYAVHAVEASGRTQLGKATVRSVFAHPAWARRGIASTIMGLIEAGITAAGFRTASLTATLSGVPLYHRLGYCRTQPVAPGLPEGLTFVGIAMTKDLTAAVPLITAKAA